MKMKNAQIKSFETILVLFVFIVLVGIGFIFYGFVAKTNSQKDYYDVQDLKSIEVVDHLSSLPELQCSRQSIVDINCFDELKIKAFKEVLKNPSYFSYYSPIIGFSEITAHVIYPDKKDLELFNNSLKTNYDVISSYVPSIIYDPINDLNQFTILEVKYYYAK